MSQETLQYLRIRRVSNPQIICGIVKGFLRNRQRTSAQNRQRISAESSKDFRGILKGYPRNHQKVIAELSNVSVDLFKDISAVRIVKGICGIA